MPYFHDGSGLISSHVEKHKCSARKHEISHISRGRLSVACATLFALGEADTAQYLSDTYLTWHGERFIPPLATSLLCAAGYITSITILYRSNPLHRYQDHWLVFGVLVAWAVGLPIGMSFNDTILKVLPWTVLGSLLGSGLMHAVLPDYTHGPRAYEKDPLGTCSSAEKFENTRRTW
jgi:hypothetical protein